MLLMVLLSGAVALMSLHVRAGGYDRIRAVNYARSNAHTRPDNYPSYGRMGDCDRCRDCTNFSSQVLEAGGYPQRKGSDDVWHWFCDKQVLGWNVSRTWRLTPDFNVYVHQYPAEFEIVCWPWCLDKGDLILLDLDRDGSPDHARVVLDTGPISQDQNDYKDNCNNNLPVPPPQNTLRVAQHCADRNNVAWDYRIGDTKGWGIHVK